MAKSKLSLINKIIFLLNNVFAIALVISFIVPKLPPKNYGVLSLMSLLTPALIILNLVFVLFWTLIGFKKQLLLSFFVLILSLFFIPPVYDFNTSSTTDNNSFHIMSYNVRKFNKFNWIKTDSIESKISKLISDENPDFIAIQEFRDLENFKLKYPYYSNPLENIYPDPISNNKYRTSLAVYSKYPMVNEGLIRNSNKSLAAMFTDIVMNEDTIRIYNFHLASLGIVPGEEYFGHKDSEKLVKRISTSFKYQQIQIDILNAHIKQCKYKVILVGDLNNTAYSWAYKNLKNNFQDSFLETGNGFGKTYEFKKFPLRIDYIFADKDMKIISHKNYKKKFSDHYPISAIIEI